MAHPPLVWRGVVVLALLLVALPSWSQGFCFTLAENYYEQVYCELKAMGKGKTLPSFRDFRNNTPTTQALLLKRPAQRAGILVPKPKKQRASSPTKSSDKYSIESRVEPLVEPLAEKSKQRGSRSSGCSYNAGIITCQDQQYSFLSNQPNSKLAGDAFANSNKMNMPGYRGSLEDMQAIRKYLSISYAIYLQKMIDIGLAGSTMNFEKFQYFFFDITEKGISFNQRFEKLYRYLKKDKRVLPVGKVAPPQQGFDASRCQKALQNLLSCSYQGRNFLFARSGAGGE